MKAETKEARDKRNAAILEDFTKGGLTKTNIAEKYGLSYQQVLKVLGKAKLTERKSGKSLSAEEGVQLMAESFASLKKTAAACDRNGQDAIKLELTSGWTAKVLAQPNNKEIIDQCVKMLERKPDSLKAEICNQVGALTGETPEEVEDSLLRFVVCYHQTDDESREPVKRITRCMERFIAWPPQKKLERLSAKERKRLMGTLFSDLLKAASKEARTKRNYAILADYAEGILSVKEIGDKYGLSHQQVHNILDKARQNGWKDPHQDRREQTNKRLSQLLFQPDKVAIYERYQELRLENPLAAKMNLCKEIAEERDEPVMRVYRCVDQFISWRNAKEEKRLSTEDATKLMAEEFIAIRTKDPYCTKMEAIRILSQRYDRSVKNISFRVTQYLLEQGRKDILNTKADSRRKPYREEDMEKVRSEYEKLLRLQGKVSPQREIIRSLSVKYGISQNLIKENVADILKDFKKSAWK